MEFCKRNNINLKGPNSTSLNLSIKISKKGERVDKTKPFDNIDIFSWEIKLRKVQFDIRLQYFRMLMLLTSISMAGGLISSLNKIEQNAEHLEKMSHFSVFSEMLVNYSLILHFGIITPPDYVSFILCLSIFVVINRLWFLKHQYSIQTSQVPSRVKRWKIEILLIVILGLDIPSMCENGSVLLACSIFPLIFQFFEGFQSGRSNLCLEYHFKYKFFQFFLLGYICGSNNPAHMKPTDRELVKYFFIIAFALSLLLIFQKFICPNLLFNGLDIPNKEKEGCRIITVIEFKEIFLETDDEEESLLSKNSSDHHECSICLASLIDSQLKMERICITPCSHFFHYKCLKRWLKLRKTCPLCRSSCSSLHF